MSFKKFETVWFCSIQFEKALHKYSNKRWRKRTYDSGKLTLNPSFCYLFDVKFEFACF